MKWKIFQENISKPNPEEHGNTKNKNHIIISIDVEKVFNKIQQNPFYDKIILQTTNRGHFLHLTKVIYKELTENVLPEERLEAF